MDPVDIVKLKKLMTITRGKPEIIIGLIDGPVDASHPAFKGARLRFIKSTNSEYRREFSPTSLHGTFIAGILCARRDSPAPGICPECSIIVRPIFPEGKSKNGKPPDVFPPQLATAIIETIKAGARIINLSLALSSTAVKEQPELADAFEYAFQKEVLLVAAAGNHGRIGHVPLFNHPWIIPVTACDLRGNLPGGVNIGPSLGKRGLMAPGMAIISTSPGAGYTKMSGTSVAAPFVTGTIALLWSLSPRLSAGTVKQAVLLSATPRKKIIPPLMDAETSRHQLNPK